MVEKTPSQKYIAIFCDTLQILFAVAVLAVIGNRLFRVSDDSIGSICFLDHNWQVRTCTYAIIVSVFSLIALIAVLIVRYLYRCAACEECATSTALELGADIVQAIWWLIAFIVLVSANARMNPSIRYVGSAARGGVIALSFFEVLLFAADSAITIWAVRQS